MTDTDTDERDDRTPEGHAPVLEPDARALAQASDGPPYLFELDVVAGRKAFDDVQSPRIEVPGTDREEVTIAGGPTGSVSLTLFRPIGVPGLLPVILYLHGPGWVFGNDHTHDRIARELARLVGAAVVFPNYTLSPEAHFPVAIEQNYVAAQWIAGHGIEHSLDSTRIAVAGDSVGGNMAASLTLTANQRGDVSLRAQVLFYPVTDASFDTVSYHEFATGYFLRRDAMQWFWDQYTGDTEDRNLITASPLRASTDQLKGLPPALVITAEADVVRDEGEAYANNLRAAGVPVIAVRYQGTIHDFLMLNVLRRTQAAKGALAQAVDFLKDALSDTVPGRREQPS